MDNVIKTCDQETSLCVVIADSVIFCPMKNTFKSIANGVEFPILVSASECFLHLIKNHGVLVTKGALMQIGWEQYGLHVSDNTYYQNILTLRKGLRQCGIDYEVIKTVPRKGLLIPSSIKIIPLSSGVRIVQETQETQETQEVQEAQVSISNISSPDQASARAVEKIPVQNQVSTRHSESLRSQRIMLLSFGILAFISLFVGGGLFVSESYSSTFHNIGNINGCRVNINEDKSTEDDFYKFNAKDPVSCQGNEVVYFSTFQFIPRVSVIKCRDEFSYLRGNDCVSNYYMENQS
ncbi:winged helix-turn-helix domain-containing protein [Serratia fonticola]|uniref:winged helix-turn-helix domain-containing protein n=1 Tax=Serratia fonticola TaxID=47917 RepID=UPI003AADAB1A